MQLLIQLCPCWNGLACFQKIKKYDGIFLSVLMQTDPHYVRTISVILFLQGGTLIEYEGKQRLLEIAQVPKEHVSTKM